MVESGSDFWRFSLRLYRMDGVAPACITLQDRHGVDVNVMLFAFWLASQSRAVSAQELEQADAAVSLWRSEAVVALRGVRRFLRAPPPAVDSQAAVALRDRVKAVELESERLQQEALFALRPAQGWGEPAPADAAAARNMDAYASFIGATFDPGAREAMLSAFRTLLARGAT